MHGPKRQKIAGEGDGGQDVTPTPSAPPPPSVTPDSDTPLGSPAPEPPPFQGVLTKEDDLETFIANPTLTEDKILRTLEATWCIPGGLTQLRQMKADIPAAFVSGWHRTVLQSPTFGFDQEVMIDMFRKANKPTFVIKLLALHQHRGQNYVALFLERIESESSRGKTGGLGSSWSSFFKTPIFCSVELEIANSEGVTICKRESSSGHFAECDSKGWSLFATHSQILDNNVGNDVLINCKIKAVSSKPFTILHSPSPSPLSSTIFSRRLPRPESAPPAPAPAAAASSAPPTPTPSESDIPNPFETFLKNSDTDITAMDVDDEDFSATATTTTPDSHPKVRIAAAIKILKKQFAGYEIPNAQLKIKCKDQEFIANFLPLAARSERLLNLWCQDESGFLANGLAIRLDDQDPGILRCALEYLCNDNCSILEENNLVDKLELLGCAYSFGIEDLMNDLLGQIFKSLEPETALLVVDKLTTIGLLQDKTFDPYMILEDYVIKNRKEIRKTPQFLADPNGCRLLLLQFLV